MNWRTRVESELALSRDALREDNDGRARACARRAVGYVLSAYNVTFPDHAIPGHSAVEKLRTLACTTTFPDAIRNAATRLTTNVNRRLSVEFTLNPVLDAGLLIDFFTERINEKAP